ncbi:MAG: hypothetical protein A2Y82_03900 [Candidatus Buchananbacteria bacterium RBG_13_36_9]|uniref:Uncharacterized protein n=1 Tax=Candidatus Buchananbacteria bacterium RBG_13_36_9 TaxID=1797530 RepID=A0A1G1XN30_9BACT|nr:MAG: hypothetical protein A2Y82_03900 [Candidatus Buchananbacteria bacterium RBG_13_36_9]
MAKNFRQWEENFLKNFQKALARNFGQTIKLKADQLAAGMLVRAWDEKELLKNEQGKAIVFITASSTELSYPRLYQLKEWLAAMGQLENLKALKEIVSMRFQPLKIYNPNKAPSSQHYVAYLPKKKGQADYKQHFVYKDKVDNFRLGNCQGKCEVIKHLHQAIFPLPPKTVLVSIDEAKKILTPNQSHS